jgi:GntR family transcriptional regulator
MEHAKLSKLPLHFQAQRLLRSEIEEGTYPPGAQLPPEVELAAQLGISRPTVRAALQHLEQAGVVARRHGLGTFVAPRGPVLDYGLEVLESLDSHAHRLGLNTKVTHLHVAERAATAEELVMLKRPADEQLPVLSIDRVIAIAGESIAYLQDVVPTVYLRREELEESFSGSVLDILLRRGDPIPVASRTELLAEKADRRIAAQLDVLRGAPLLKLVGQVYSDDNRILEYSTGHFVPGHFEFHVLRRVRKP